MSSTLSSSGDGVVPTGAPAPRKKRRLRTVLLVLVGLVVAAVAILFAAGVFTAVKDGADKASLGDCLDGAPTGSEVSLVVGCDDSKAVSVVVGRVDDVDEQQARADNCAAFKETKSLYWTKSRVGGGKGTLLCLKPA